MGRRIYVAADHAGFRMKEAIVRYLANLEYAVEDLGNTRYDPHDDYPDFGYREGIAVARAKGRGILICGSGEGVCIVANKVPGIRAVVGWNTWSARASRNDDDANVLCLPARALSIDEAKRVVRTWLSTPFSRAARHVRRIKKIDRIERSARR